MITCTRPWALRLDFREAQIKLTSRKMTFFREQMKWLMWRFWGAKRETVFCFYSFILKLTLQMFYLYPGSSPLTLRCSRALSDLNSCRHQRCYSLTPLIKSRPLESQVGPIAVRPPSSAQRFFKRVVGYFVGLWLKWERPLWEHARSRGQFDPTRSLFVWAVDLRTVNRGYFPFVNFLITSGHKSNQINTNNHSGMDAFYLRCIFFNYCYFRNHP